MDGKVVDVLGYEDLVTGTDCEKYYKGKVPERPKDGFPKKCRKCPRFAAIPFVCAPENCIYKDLKDTAE